MSTMRLSLLYLQRLASGSTASATSVEMQSVLVRASTFAGEGFDKAGELGHKLRDLLERNKKMIQLVEQSKVFEKETLDWCHGTRELFTLVEGPNPCEMLVRGFEELQRWVTEWLSHCQPEKFLRHLRRRQFAAAPNISRVEILSQLLQRSAEICQVPPSDKMPSELPAILKTIADEEVSNLESEHNLLAESVEDQFGSKELERAPLAATELARPGLLGLARNSLKAQWIFESTLLAVAGWADRIKRRGNGLQNRLALVKHNLEDLHERLRRLPIFRRLAFEEIHAAGHWGRRLSGGGSSVEITEPLTRHLLTFLEDNQAESLVDIGCGWGEWIPFALQRGVEEKKLPQSFRYLGVDIAWQPVQHLQNLYKGSVAPALDFSVLDGVQDEIPKGYDVALVRYVFQHLNIKDALSLLRNLRSAGFRFVVLSSWPESENEDLDNFGGSSAYAAMEPKSLQKFKSYDLRKAPFNLPEPWVCPNLFSAFSMFFPYFAGLKQF